MANLTIKNLSDELYEQLRESAAANHRSIVAEATVLLERGLGFRRMTEEEIKAQAQLLSEKTALYLTQKDLRSAIKEGRK